MSGCTSYECFGAGQHVTQVVYAGASWRDSADGGAEMFAVFAVVQRLHEMLVLLDQADCAGARAPDLARLRERVAGHTTGRPSRAPRRRAGPAGGPGGGVLARVSRRCAATGRRTPGRTWSARTSAPSTWPGRPARRAAPRRRPARRHLDRTDLLGADLRDADLSGADLSTALFLTQPQLNCARGSASTLLPTPPPTVLLAGCPARLCRSGGV